MLFRSAISWLALVLVMDLPMLITSVKPGGLACEGCHGVVTELYEKLSKPTKASMEKRVPELLGKICKLENLVKYVFSPPKMVKACNELLENHKPAIRASLIRHFTENPQVTANELESDICFTIAGSCTGIKASPQEESPQTIQADVMLDANGKQEIVFEQDGDQMVPQTKPSTEKPNKLDEPKKDKPKIDKKDSNKKVKTEL